MPNTDLSKRVTPAMLLKNHVLAQAAPRVGWNAEKQRAKRAGVDVARFNKRLGPALDQLVRSLEAANTVAKAGGQLDKARKKAIKDEFDKVAEIADGYLDMIKADLRRQDLTAAQRSALESLKNTVKSIPGRYDRLARRHWT